MLFVTMYNTESSKQHNNMKEELSIVRTTRNTVFCILYFDNIHDEEQEA